jgi:beta-glucuronidase
VSFQPSLPPLIQNVHARHCRSLNGAWHSIVDPYENGAIDYRGQPLLHDGYFANKKPASKSDRIEYDFDASPTLAVPGDWNSQRRELFFYEGTVWYKTGFDLVPEEGRRLFAYFGAANYSASVYLNGTHVGSHSGGFTPFNVELTGLLREHDNFLVVKVDNQRRREGVPTSNTDWWNYGGLTRDVLLVEVPRTFVRDYSFELASDRRAIRGVVRLDGPAPVQSVHIRIPELRQELTLQTDAAGLGRFELDVTPELWSPAKPKLYDVEIEAGGEQIQDRIGFRTLTTRGSEILLNGEPLFLCGISLHEQAPEREGRAHGRDDAEKLLGWARELGANFVRLAHYPHNEHTTRLADELGLLLWSEIPVYWTIDWANAETLANAKQQLSEMISRDKNRASIIIWSVGNETPPSSARLEFMSELVRTARELDPTRLISAALEKREPEPDLALIDDPLGELLDVLGCNEYIGWYDGLPDKADRVRWRVGYDKPLVITEFGADALQGLHGDALTRWSEEYQASVYEHQLAMLERIPCLRGLTPWILTDFRSPRRPLPGVQDYWNRKGLISDRGLKKQAFFVLQNFYRARARR